MKKQELTHQQSAIINSSGDLRINAVAGSGKTTTIIEYAASRPANARILYLAFNKSVKLEAVRKFSDYGLTNTKVETAHSLAYKHIVFQHNYKVKAQGYKISEICQLLGIRGNGEKHAEFVIANHINKFVTYFCNSDKAKVQDLNYLDTMVDVNAKAFVKSFYKFIEDGTRVLLAKMDRGEIEITHDFYLKKFQLSNPALPYDYILFDEAQDASAAMLDVFKKQKATKVIVGDTHQQIYSWRHAVNSLDKTDFDTLQLSSSFRFTQDIANLATEIISWKNHLFECKPVAIDGKGTGKREVVKATIARTNLGLLLNAIDFITDNSKVKHIYFEGNISSYMYADDGASLYDVLSLYNGNHDRIRDQLVGSMKDIDDLEEYVEKTEDHQLATMIEIVREYGNEVHGIIKSLKELHTGDEDRSKAEMIFSTVHRSKGMEYDVVYLVNDFLSEGKLKDLKEKHKNDKSGAFDVARLNEEINLLYVAITRTRNKLHIPEALVPKDFPASSQIIKVKTRESNPEYNSFSSEKKSGSKQSPATKKQIVKPKEKAYTVIQRRETNKDAYKPWTPEQDYELKEIYDNGTPISRIAAHLGRTKGAVISRLKKLNHYFDDL
ncbi:ATP-dependent helicase [Niastella caeni]|uniref:DNA 3'-5' helicase n=1 Tax=Niastella caeni TaxID=2569763 RepID=A0A4S8I1R2_9BACT|nr:ATP-dependent helicase [Niastella caeni]